MREADVLVVGAGPAGAATALGLARAGHEVVVIDRAGFPRDKACGEGLQPPGVAALRRLGLLEAVLATGARQHAGVTYTHVGEQPRAEATFPAPADRTPAWGLGVRRLSFDAALVAQLHAEPRVTVLENTRATRLRTTGDGTFRGVATNSGAIGAEVIVAADGLRSPMRHAAGWTARVGALQRYGIAGHWHVDTSDIPGITVSFAREHEWYQAPVGPHELLVSALGRRHAIGRIARDYAGSVARALPHLRGAEILGPPMSVGLLDQAPSRLAGNGLFLVGDASGYLDPCTGEGIGLALLQGEALASALSPTLHKTASLEDAERSYQRRHTELGRNRRRVTRLALFMAGHPRLSRSAMRRLSTRGDALSTLLGINCGYWGFERLSARDWLSLAGL